MTSRCCCFNLLVVRDTNPALVRNQLQPNGVVWRLIWKVDVVRLNSETTVRGYGSSKMRTEIPINEKNGRVRPPVHTQWPR
jgi:hypothetical protein